MSATSPSNFDSCQTTQNMKFTSSWEWLDFFFLRYDWLHANIVDQSSLASFKVLCGCTLVNIHFAAIDQRRRAANW